MSRHGTAGTRDGEVSAPTRSADLGGEKSNAEARSAPATGSRAGRPRRGLRFLAAPMGLLLLGGGVLLVGALVLLGLAASGWI